MSNFKVRRNNAILNILQTKCGSHILPLRNRKAVDYINYMNSFSEIWGYGGDNFINNTIPNRQ